MRNTTNWTAAAVAGALLLAPVSLADDRDKHGHLGYELVGQVLNPNSQQSMQYGYLNYVGALQRIATPGSPVSESTALLTFFNDTTTERVINNGAIRVVDRTGTGTIYFDPSGNGNFGNPDTFRDGTAVQTYSLRHQVVIDTVTGFFTTTFEIRITARRKFEIDGRTYRFAKPGTVYRLVVFGKLATQPSAHIAGFADGAGGVEADEDE
jgi:hypothetical protein